MWGGGRGIGYSTLKGLAAKGEQRKKFHEESRKKGCNQIMKVRTK
jgi:hypothetical protein